MQQLTIVIVSGGYGVGKTRLLDQLASGLDPGARAIALVHQTGPVNLDPLWLPGLPVVTLEQGCACSGGSELAQCLRLVQERGFSVALVELAGDQEAAPLVRAAAGLEGATVMALEAAEVGRDVTLDALLQRPREPQSEPEQGCGCGHEHGHGQLRGGCVSAQRRAEPQWMPFWYAKEVEVDRLCETLGRLPGEVVRVKGFLRRGEEQWLRVDRAGGQVTRSLVTADDLPELYDVESLAEGETLDSTPPDGGALLLLWTRAADPDASVALEWEVARALADCFGVVEDPAEAAAFAAESLDAEELVFEALAAARAAAVAEPAVADHVELMAKLYHQLGENERALVLLREAVRREPDHRSSRLNAARLHLVYDEHEQARALAEAVVVDHPDDADAHAVLGEALAVQGHFDEAAGHLEAAAAGLPEDDVLRSLICNVYAELGDYARALAYNSEVLSLDADDDGAMYLRGELLLRLGRPDDAAQSLEQALAAGNESPWVMTALGIAQAQCGRMDEAAGCFADAFVLAQEQLEELPDDSAAVDLLLAATFRGRLDQIPEVWGRLDALDVNELRKARDTLSLAPDRGEAPKTLAAIERILLASDR